jgi:hypothetical protein
MEALAFRRQRTKSCFSKGRGIKTTLYELIEAVTNEVESGEEELVAGAVLDLIESRKMKWIRGDKDSNDFQLLNT